MDLRGFDLFSEAKIMTYGLLFFSMQFYITIIQIWKNVWELSCSHTQRNQWRHYVSTSKYTSVRQINESITSKHYVKKNELSCFIKYSRSHCTEILQWVAKPLCHKR